MKTYIKIKRWYIALYRMRENNDDTRDYRFAISMGYGLVNPVAKGFYFSFLGSRKGLREGATIDHPFWYIPIKSCV